MKNILFLCCLGLLLGCNSTKKEVEGDFTTGVIVYSMAENDCEYAIKVTNSNEEVVYFDPINLDNGYMKNNVKVKFKFRALKMQNRCAKANPISITEMLKL